MNVKTKALTLNLVAFGVLFVLFRIGIGILIPLPYLPLLLGSADGESVATTNNLAGTRCSGVSTGLSPSKKKKKKKTFSLL